MHTRARYRFGSPARRNHLRYSAVLATSSDDLNLTFTTHPPTVSLTPTGHTFPDLELERDPERDPVLVLASVRFHTSQAHEKTDRCHWRTTAALSPTHAKTRQSQSCTQRNADSPARGRAGRRAGRRAGGGAVPSTVPQRASLGSGDACPALAPVVQRSNRPCRTMPPRVTSHFPLPRNPCPTKMPNQEVGTTAQCCT